MKFDNVSIVMYLLKMKCQICDASAINILCRSILIEINGCECIDVANCSDERHRDTVDPINYIPTLLTFYQSEYALRIN